MKKKKISFLILITCGLIISVIMTGFTSIAQETVFTNTEIIEIDDGTDITVSIATPLTWIYNERNNISITLRLSSVEVGTNLTIVYIATTYNVPGYLRTDSINENLTEIDQEINIIQQNRLAPDNVDDFNITLEIYAQTSNMTNPEQYFMDFPGEGEQNITIKRNVVLPIIQLPGFPNPETFVRWIIIFVIILVIITLPASFVGVLKLKEIRNKRKQQGGKKDE